MRSDNVEMHAFPNGAESIEEYNLLNQLNILWGKSDSRQHIRTFEQHWSNGLPGYGGKVEVTCNREAAEQFLPVDQEQVRKGQVPLRGETLIHKGVGVNFYDRKGIHVASVDYAFERSVVHPEKFMVNPFLPNELIIHDFVNGRVAKLQRRGNRYLNDKWNVMEYEGFHNKEELVVIMRAIADFFIEGVKKLPTFRLPDYPEDIEETTDDQTTRRTLPDNHPTPDPIE